MSRKRTRSDLRVFLQDEAPRVGCGWRGVKIRKVGPKWAHLVETATGTGFKVPRRVWDSMQKCGRKPK